MIDQTVIQLMRQYGQSVELVRAGEVTPTRAFLQPITRKREEQAQYLPTPLGLRREDDFLYLGPPQLELKAGRDRVRWGGRTFLIRTAHPIYVGSGISHWWAVLVPADKEET